MLATAENLSEAAVPLLLLSVDEGAALERSQLERKLLGELASVADGKSRAVLEMFERLLRRDLALLSGMEAACQNPPPVDLRAEAARIAGFDAVGFVEREFASGRTVVGLPSREPAVVLRELVSAVSRRLGALDLDAMVSLSHQVSADLGVPERGHELWSLADRLSSAVLRLQSELGDRFAEAVRLYRRGQIEVSEIARLLGWPPEKVAFEFERLGVARTLDAIRLTPAARAERLAQIARTRGRPSASLARRDAIASQRIEGIDARAHLPASDES